MRTHRRRWLAPLVAALLLIGAGPPAGAVAAAHGAPVAVSTGAGAPQGDDAVRPSAADHAERGTVTERSPQIALVPAATTLRLSGSIGTARPPVRIAPPADATPNTPRAPPGRPTPS